MFSVLRVIHFSYGHRLLNHPGKCARLHGHNGKVIVEISSERLNDQKMVMDFYDIRKVVKSWIDNHLDHRMILCKSDPLTPVLQKAGESIVILEENPTAETLARWIFEETKKQGIPVSKISLWETEDSAAVYQDEKRGE